MSCENLFAGDEITFEFSKKFTYRHAWMKHKAFYMNAMLPANSICKGKILATAEILSPLAESLLVKDWLVKIDARLPNHIRKTRGHLFTPAKPTLACNQKALSDQIPQMLVELSRDQDSAQIGRLSMSQYQQKSRPQSQQNSKPQYQVRPRSSAQFSSQIQRRPASSTNQQPSCFHCLQAGKVDVARTHTSSACYSQTNRS